MAKIEDIVNVIIALGARPLTQAGFETPIFITSHKLWDDRFRVYTDSDGATDDGFDSDSPAVKALNAFFSQTFAPSQVVIGRRDFDDWTITVDDVPVEGTVYSFDIVHRTGTVNTRDTVSFTATATETTADLLATALAAAVTTATSGAVTATAATNTITLTLGTADTIVLVDEASTDLSIVLAGLEGADDAIVAITEVYDDYFFITSDSDNTTDIEDLAEYAEANKKIYGYSIYDANIFSSGSTTDIAYTLNSKGYANTFGIALTAATQRSEYAECAAIGSMASVTPGSSVLHGKTLRGITATRPTSTQTTVAETKKINMYVYIAGAGFFLNGFVASGGFFDNTRGILWLEARMEEDIFLYLTNKSNLGKKIPADNTGITEVAGVMRKRLNIAVRNGLLTTDPSYQIFQPDRADISSADLTNRYLPDIPFTATLAGAFQKIDIKGYVTI